MLRTAPDPDSSFSVLKEFPFLKICHNKTRCVLWFCTFDVCLFYYPFSISKNILFPPFQLSLESVFQLFLNISALFLKLADKKNFLLNVFSTIPITPSYIHTVESKRIESLSYMRTSKMLETEVTSYSFPKDCIISQQLTRSHSYDILFKNRKENPNMCCPLV